VSTDLVNRQEDLEETEKSLVDDTKFLRDLGKSCATKEDEWDARSKMRSEELLALADTIKILNDDDALNLFKKALPSPMFLQVQVSGKQVMHEARHALGADKRHDPRLDFISLAMRGKKPNFDKVTGLIDEMVALLRKEQADDDKKQVYCRKEFDVAEDAKKALKRKKGQLTTTISEGKSAIDSLKEEIATLDASIKDTDKKVVEATALRKKENAEYRKELGANSAAKSLLVMAEDRIKKAYQKTEDAPADAPADASAASFVQVASRKRLALFEAPPPPPETFGAYSKKGAETTWKIILWIKLKGEHGCHLDDGDFD